MYPNEVADLGNRSWQRTAVLADQHVAAPYAPDDVS